MLFISFFIYFFCFIFFTDSSELHLFIHSRHSRGFAVQFERNHVLSTKKTLKITVKVFFYYQTFFTSQEWATSAPFHDILLYICCFSFFWVITNSKPSKILTKQKFFIDKSDSCAKYKLHKHIFNLMPSICFESWYCLSVVTFRFSVYLSSVLISRLFFRCYCCFCCCCSVAVFILAIMTSL